MIIDTHLHTWDLQKLSYYWLENDRSLLAKTYTLASFEPELVASPVRKAVLVQATNQLTETDWLLALAASHSFLEGAVVWLPLQQPEEVNRLLQHYLLNPYFKGVRHQIHDETNEAWLLQPRVLESLQLLAVNEIPYDIVGIKAAHIKTAISVAEKIPTLKMVFDHLNQPPISDKLKWIEWTKLMKDAASHPNLYAKISGLGTASQLGYHWNAAAIQPSIEMILGLFGGNRVFCGGDWPVCLLAGSYQFTWQQYIRVFTEILSETDQKLVYHKNAAQFYHLNA